MMHRSVERAYPYAVPLVGAALCWRYHVPYPTGEGILSASITIGAVFVGFLATAESIVIGLHSPKIDQFKATKFFPLLLQYLQEAIWFSLIYCAFCLFGFFCPTNPAPLWFAPAWLFLPLATLLLFQRMSLALIRLVRAS